MGKESLKGMLDGEWNLFDTIVKGVLLYGVEVLERVERLERVKRDKECAREICKMDFRVGENNAGVCDEGRARKG